MIIAFAKSFQEDIEKISDQQVLTRLNSLLQSLEQAPSLTEIHNLKKLKTSGSYYRIRFGDYRVGLKFENGQLHLIRFLHRKDMYRYFP
jgi:mRNA interferase RelE/StbE